MPNQPMQINRKEFQELLKEIQQYNKLDLVAQAIQTKYAKEMTGEDHEERLKAQLDNNDILKKIYEAILNNGKQTEKVADNVNKLAKETKNYKPVSDIKDDKPATMKEDLKSLVAGTKRFGSGIKSAVTGLLEPKRTPSGDIKAGAGFLEKIGTAGKDIISTPEDYTVEGGRFAEAYSKTAEGTRFQKGGKGSLDIGLEKFNELKAKEEEIKGVEQKINEQKKYGFEPNKEDVKQLETLKSQYAEADIRQKPVSAKEKIEAQAKTDNPNVIDEPNEVVAEETKKQSVTFKELLDTTKESLDQLKAIRDSLEGTPASQSGAPAAKPAAAAAAAAPAQQESGGGLLGDLAESGVGKKAMGAAKGFGAKAFGALKAGGAMLGKGALAAGKVIGGAALAKPALIAAGVGLAAYGAYKGYKALTSGGEGAAAGADPELEKAKESKQAKALQQLASEGKYTFSGEGRNVNVFNKETGELVQTIQAPDRISGKELIEVAGVGGGTAGAQKPVAKPETKGEAQEPTLKEKSTAAAARKDSAAFMAAGRETNPDGTASPEMKTFMQADLDSRIADDQLRKQQDEAAKSGKMGLKAQHEQFMKDTKPGSGYKENAQVSSKGGFGDKVGSFFGGIKDSVVGAAGKVGAAVGTAGAAVGSFASGLKDKVMDTAQYVSEEYDRDISATANTDKLDAEVDKRMKEAGVEPFSQEANNIRKQVRKEMVAADPNAFMMSETKIGTEQSFKEDSVSAGKKYDLSKSKLESGITAQKSLFGSSFLGSMLSKEGQRTGQFLSESENQEVLLANEAELGLGSDLPVEYKKRSSSSLLGERISSGSMFKRDKYKVTDTQSRQDLNVSKDEYKKLEALVAEGKAEEAQNLFDEINAREAAYVPEKGITPEEQMVAPSKGASNLAAVRDTTVENAAMKEEMAAGKTQSTPVVMNNVSNNNTTTYVPVKGEPRPNSRGSALDRYNDRVAAY